MDADVRHHLHGVARPLAIVCGTHVSSAFTLLGAGYLANTMGAVMFLGGLCALVGVLRRDHMVEAIGLVGMAMGCILYSLGVMLGLGVGGQVAGPIALAAAVAMMLAAVGIVTDARRATVAVEAATPSVWTRSSPSLP